MHIWAPFFGGNLAPYSLWMWDFSLTQTFISGLLFLGETSVHILCECETLALLKHAYLGSLFLEPKDIQSISLGAIWSFSKASGLPWLDMGHKRPALRPRCIGAVRSRTLDKYSYSYSLTLSDRHTQSVGLLWTRDRPVAETSTWQHTTSTKDRYPCPRRDSDPESQQGSGRWPTHLTARPPGSVHA
jgi:hypothetical protein